MEATKPNPRSFLPRTGLNLTHVIIEETTTFLSFLYSVWKTNGDSVTLTYTFHIASTVRLAEAVVTGIVLGESSGGGCFGMLRAFSQGPEPPENEYEDEMMKASPFGENPQSGKVEKLTDVETIEAGIDVNVAAMSCLVCVLCLTVVGIVWAVYLGKSTGMDIYDRWDMAWLVDGGSLTWSSCVVSVLRSTVDRLLHCLLLAWSSNLPASKSDCIRYNFSSTGILTHQQASPAACAHKRSFFSCNNRKYSNIVHPVPPHLLRTTAGTS